MNSRIYSAIDSFWNFEQRLLGKKWLILVLFISNLLGAIVGFNYYIEIIDITSDFPPILWVLIPDCPMAVFLLIGFYLQRDDQHFLNFDFFVFIQGIRGAIFTYLIVMNFPSIDIEIVILGHTFLLFQAFLILPFLKDLQINKGTFLVIFLTLFNDFMDFFGFFSLFPPTLAQLPTIQPMFFAFVVLIVGLDCLMILIGLCIRYFNVQKKTHQTSVLNA
jgi:uncharacterized membrane protein YpjA